MSKKLMIFGVMGLAAGALLLSEARTADAASKCAYMKRMAVDYLNSARKYKKSNPKSSARYLKAAKIWRGKFVECAKSQKGASTTKATKTTSGKTTRVVKSKRGKKKVSRCAYVKRTAKHYLYSAKKYKKSNPTRAKRYMKVARIWRKKYQVCVRKAKSK